MLKNWHQQHPLCQKSSHESKMDETSVWIFLVGSVLWSSVLTAANGAHRRPNKHTNTTVLRPSWILSSITQVSRHQKGKTRKVNLSGLTAARDSEWQWYELGHMQICTLTQTHNHASILPLSFFYGPDALPAAQPTASKQWRQCKALTQYKVLYKRSLYLHVTLNGDLQPWPSNLTFIWRRRNSMCQLLNQRPDAYMQLTNYSRQLPKWPITITNLVRYRFTVPTTGGTSNVFASQQSFTFAHQNLVSRENAVDFPCSPQWTACCPQQTN